MVRITGIDFTADRGIRLAGQKAGYVSNDLRLACLPTPGPFGSEPGEREYDRLSSGANGDRHLFGVDGAVPHSQKLVNGRGSHALDKARPSGGRC